MIDYKEELKHGLEDLVKKFRSLPEKELSATLVLAHIMRIYLIENEMLPEDILYNPEPNSEVWNFFIIKMAEFSYEGQQKTNIQEIAFIGGATLWFLTMAASLEPDCKKLGQQVWRELERGFREALALWQESAGSAYGYDISNSKLLSTVKKDLITVPAALREDENDYEERRRIVTNKTMKHYFDLIKAINDTKENQNFVLAMVHFVRLLLVNINSFPEELWEKAEPDIFKLEQYIEPITHYMHKLPAEDEVDRVMYLCTKIWCFTLTGLIMPSYYKDITRQMWQELIKGADGAYEIFAKQLYTPSLYSEKTKLLLDNLEEDIKKIPAALR